MNLNDFSKWLQYNKEWKIQGGLNTFRTHCIYIYIYLTSWIVCTELEFSKGLQRIYQSCKQTVTQVRTNLTQVLCGRQDWLVFFLMRLFLCPSDTHALLLHLRSGSGAGPGAELWDASGSLHPAEPDLHHGTTPTCPFFALLISHFIINVL